MTRGAEEYLTLAQESLGGGSYAQARAYAEVGRLAAVVAEQKRDEAYDEIAARAMNGGDLVARIGRVISWHDECAGLAAAEFADQHERGRVGRVIMAQEKKTIHEESARRLRQVVDGT